MPLDEGDKAVVKVAVLEALAEHPTKSCPLVVRVEALERARQTTAMRLWDFAKLVIAVFLGWVVSLYTKGD